MFCTSCGKEIMEGAAFCSNCGAKVQTPEKPAYEVAPVIAEPTVEETPVAEVPAYEVAPVIAEPQKEEPVYIPPIAPVTEPVYEPSYQQSQEVKNNGRVGFGDAIALLFKNIVNFSGKASRSEFWFGYLFIGLVNIAAMIIPYIGFLISLATALPCISLSVRRIRDTGKNWNYIFMGFIPIVGAILLIITFCKETDSEKE